MKKFKLSINFLALLFFFWSLLVIPKLDLAETEENKLCKKINRKESAKIIFEEKFNKVIVLCK